jgi:hypothetical protein
VFKGEPRDASWAPIVAGGWPILRALEVEVDIGVVRRQEPRSVANVDEGGVSSGIAPQQRSNLEPEPQGHVPLRRWRIAG